MGKLPKILFLMREKIEQKADIRPTTPEEFDDLVKYLKNYFLKLSNPEKHKSYSLSEKTIRRLWEKEKYDSAPSMTTLNILAKVAGYKRWEDFENNIENFAKISCSEAEDIPMRKLKTGDRVLLGNYPVNYLFMEFLYDNRFKVLFSVGNHRLSKECFWFYTEDL